MSTNPFSSGPPQDNLPRAITPRIHTTMSTPTPPLTPPLNILIIGARGYTRTAISRDVHRAAPTPSRPIPTHGPICRGKGAGGVNASDYSVIERGQSAGTDGLEGTEGGNSGSDGNTVVWVQWELSVDGHYISAAKGGGGGRLVVWASSGERLFMGCILMMPPRGTICSVGNAWDCLMSRCGGMGRWMASARR